MSVIVTTEIFCNWCSKWIEGTISDRASAQESRRIAYEEGWKYRWSVKRQQYEDICPSCLKELRKEEENDKNVA